MIDEPAYKVLLIILESIFILKTPQLFAKLVKEACILSVIKDPEQSAELFSENDEQDGDFEEEIVMIPATN